MNDDDRRLIAWSQGLREERQEIDQSRVFRRLDPNSGEPLPGWIGIQCSAENNETGTSRASIEVRPVLRGRLEMIVSTDTRRIGSDRAHSKTVYLSPTPEALREFALQLLETADEAERLRRAAGPKLVD